MNLLETYQPLLSKKSHLTSQEAMGITGCRRPKTSKDLSRLVKLGKLIKIHRGKWMVLQNANRLQLPELLSTAPTYCTAHTALAWHGMIEQIPNAIYAVTTGRPMKKTTPMGPVHIHRISPELFQGWENQSTRAGGDNPAKIATPEKALMDFFYLAIMGHPHFQSLPEITLPLNFDWDTCGQFADMITNKGWKTAVKSKLTQLEAVCDQTRDYDSAEM